MFNGNALQLPQEVHVQFGVTPRQYFKWVGKAIRLHLTDKEWKVYDVVIENVSIVNNYRSQFARVINRSSYEGLIRAMRKKTLSK
jgi:hypothetical protein